ncbi:baseplate J-like protein [Paraburkholderia unamae]|uniref:Baseplate J-like protein n=2 Tax=Paraburkholderia unamae TaxID=219649 RepID=A0ABX5KAK6_9BURK|nr:baseplate J-like protein [Paraburkholderia unamae]
MADINSAFGGNLTQTNSDGTLALTTPQGQLATSDTAIIGDANDQFLYLANGVDPAYASGRMQDGIGRIYFLTRLAAQPTTLQVACGGLQGVVILVGSQIQDSSGNVYACTTQGTIPVSGTITLPFACVSTGPIAVPASNGISIYRAISGWDTVTCVSGVIGRNVETRAAFELRRQQSVAANAVNTNDAILGTVLAVSGVVDAYVIDNYSSAPETIGGVTLGANSLYVCVAGSFTPLTVAQAIFTKKPPGCAYNGNTSETVTDPNPIYSTPPSYTVKFQTAVNIPIFFAITLKNSAMVPSNALTLIQGAIDEAFSGADDGIVPRIGSEIFASRFYSNIASLGSWAQIITLQIGCVNVPTTQFTGSISGNTLTVSSVASGAIAIGQFISDTTGIVASGTQITAGSGTSWTVSIAQTVASETMYGVVPNQNDVTMNINQEPTFSAANVILTLV